MGLFTRRAHEPRDGPVATTTHEPKTAATSSRFGFMNRNQGHGSKSPVVMSMSTRPKFGQWLKVTWLDIVTMAIMGLIGLGVTLPSPKHISRN
jgi:diacylglycerol diphosphate phosphatase/phosphatidate phosphatase